MDAMSRVIPFVVVAALVAAGPVRLERVGLPGPPPHRRPDDRAAAGRTAAAVRGAARLHRRARRRPRPVAQRRLGPGAAEPLPRRSRLLRHVSVRGAAARVRPGGAEVRPRRGARAGTAAVADGRVLRPAASGRSRRCRGPRRRPTSSTTSCSSPRSSVTTWPTATCRCTPSPTTTGSCSGRSARTRGSRASCSSASAAS